MSDSNDQNMAPEVRIFGLTMLTSLVQAVFKGLMVNLMGGWLEGVPLASGASDHLVTFVVMGVIHGLMG